MGGDRDAPTCRCSTCSSATRRSRCRSRRCCATSSRRPGAIERCLRVPARVRPESHRRDVDGFRAAGEDAWRPSSSARAAEYARGAERLEALGGDLLAALGRARELDLGRDPRRCCRCSPPTPASQLQVQTGIASHRRRFGDWARRLLAARVRARAVAGPAARGGGRPRDVRRADRRVRPRRRAAPATAADRRRPGAVADRPRRRSSSCGATGGYPARRRLPRLPPPHRSPPPASGRSTARPYDPARALARPAPSTRATSSPGCATACASGGVCVVRARHRAARPLVVRGRALARRGARRGARAGPAR